MNEPAKSDKTRSHLRRVVYSPTPEPPQPVARPLSWRSPGALVLAALLAFQVGLVGTLLWTLGRPPPDAAPEAASRPSSTLAVSAAPTVAPAILPPTELSPPPSPAAPSASAAPAPSASAPPSTPKAAPHSAKAPSPTPPPPSPSAARPPSPERSPWAEAPTALVEVEIRSEPEGAEVHIAGALWGLTPLTALLPPGSPVAIELKLNDYAPARLSWSSASKSRTLNAVLRPLKDL